mgnify:CR=1 FL=1
MQQIYLKCRKCKRKTKHAIFEDDYNLPHDKALVQCYECEVMGIEQVDKEQLNA